MLREISPAKRPEDAGRYYESLTRDEKAFIGMIRANKAAGLRPRPSSRLIMNSAAPEPDWRPSLIDEVALLVDENLTGRSDMCRQFAVLLQHGLFLLGIRSRALEGRVGYLRADGSWMEWEHAWVETDGGIIIDGNVDTLAENRIVGVGLNPHPYWGYRDGLPRDRKFPAGRRLSAEDQNDPDVISTWAPELRAFLRERRLID